MSQACARGHLARRQWDREEVGPPPVEGGSSQLPAVSLGHGSALHKPQVQTLCVGTSASLEGLWSVSSPSQAVPLSFLVNDCMSTSRPNGGVRCFQFGRLKLSVVRW